MLDPIEGSAAYNMEVLGVVALHVDDLLMTGSPTFHSTVVARLRKDYQVGSEDKDDIVFTGPTPQMAEQCHSNGPRQGSRRTVRNSIGEKAQR